MNSIERRVDELEKSLSGLMDAVEALALAQLADSQSLTQHIKTEANWLKKIADGLEAINDAIDKAKGKQKEPMS